MLERLLKKHEGKTLEFKESTKSMTGIIKTIVAFANTAGGTLIIGVKDATKEVVGLKDIMEEEERVANAIADSITPSMMPDIQMHTVRNREILVLRVYHGVGPYYVKSLGPDAGVYIRLGSTTRVADNETVRQLRLFATSTSFDEIPCLQSSKTALDWDLIKHEFKKVKKIVSDQKARMLGIMTQHSGKLYPTMGGILLFGKNRLTLFPDAFVRCARFAGIEKITFLDQMDIEDSIPQAIDKILFFIKKNTRLGSVIGEKRRVDIPEYPPVAVREAVINALLHADYAVQGSRIMIAIFDDRLEITNPGVLHFGMTMEHALDGSSSLRNKVIGRVLRELHLIEQWGSGIKRIRDAYATLSLREPLFEELGNQFRITLYAHDLRSVTASPYRTMALLGTEDDEKIVDYLKKNKKISTKQAAELIGITTRAVQGKLKRMVDRGVLCKVATSSKDPHAYFILSEIH